jgi:uncharacterized protein YqhQ
MHAPYFWDIVGPMVLIVFVANFIWSIFSYRKKAIYRLFLSVIFSLVACNIFWWSIGKFMAIVPFFQFIGVLHLLIKNNFRSMEKKG